MLFCRGYSSVLRQAYNVTVRLFMLLSWALCRGNVSGFCCRSLINSYFRIMRLTYMGGFLGVYALLVLLSVFAVSVRPVGVWWLIWRAFLLSGCRWCMLWYGFIMSTTLPCTLCQPPDGLVRISTDFHRIFTTRTRDTKTEGQAKNFVRICSGIGSF